MTKNVHYHALDLLAQDFYEGLQKRIAWVRDAMGQGPPVGTRELSREEQVAAFLAMSPVQRDQLAAAGANLAPAMRSLFDMLGEHAFSILPYLTPPQEMAQQAFDPNLHAADQALGG